MTAALEKDAEAWAGRAKASREECERAERDLSDLRDQNAAQSTAPIKATDTAQADRRIVALTSTTPDTLVDFHTGRGRRGGAGPLGLLWRGRGEGGGGGRRARRQGPGRAASAGGCGAGGAGGAARRGPRGEKIRELEETRRTKEAEFDGAARRRGTGPTHCNSAPDAEEARLRAASSQADVAASRLAAIEARCAELDTRSAQYLEEAKGEIDRAAAKTAAADLAAEQVVALAGGARREIDDAAARRGLTSKSRWGGGGRLGRARRPPRPTRNGSGTWRRRPKPRRRATGPTRRRAPLPSGISISR